MRSNDLRRWTPPAVLTVPWLERAQAAHRRERLIRYGVALAALVLPSVIAWVAVGAMMGSP